MSNFDLDVIGTHLSIRVESSSLWNIDEDFSLIRERLIAFESRFSRFLAENWLYELNMTRSGVLDNDAREMIIFALDLAKRSDGYFDPTVGKRLTELGYGNRYIIERDETSLFESILRENRVGIPYIRSWDYRDIHIEWDRIELTKDVELEFWGVGKGYLLDVIQGMIEAWNVGNLESLAKPNTPNLQPANPRYLINFGGDLFGRGWWKVGLESPFDPEEIIGTIELDDRFLACSAGTKRKWGNHHHLIDPHTGVSAQDVIAAYIEWDSGMLVDGYATALSVMPWERACETLESTPEIEWVLVQHDGSLYQSKGSQSEVFE